MNTRLAMIIVLLFGLQAAATTTHFEGRLVDGRVLSGPIIDWHEGQITLETGDGEQRIDIDQFASLTNPRFASKHHLSSEQQEPGCEITVGLKGGTRLCGTSISGTADALTLKRGTGFSLTLPAHDLKYVRFCRPTAELRKQWKEMLEGDFTGDVLVIRRRPDSLDFLEGVIRGISDHQVVFEFEQERIEVKRDKLEGCLFFSRRQEPSPAASMVVSSTAGDRILAKQITIQEQQWHVQTVEGMQLIVAADQIQSVKFRSNRVTYVSDMQPVATDVTAAIGSLTGTNQYLNLIYAPRRDRGYDGPLQLYINAEAQLQTFDKGIALHSRTLLTFRLDGGNARLMGLAGLAPESGSGGATRLAISVDGRVVFDRIIQWQADAVALDVDVSGGRRLEILADYGDDGDMGDRLYLCDLRIIK